MPYSFSLRFAQPNGVGWIPRLALGNRSSYAMHNALPAIITVLDWVGTLMFALSGVLLGVRREFDLFGVLFLSFLVTVASGMMRDVLIGAVPPVAITEIHYPIGDAVRHRIIETSSV